MEERTIPALPVGLPLFLAGLKEMRVSYEYEYLPNGSYMCWLSDWAGVWGEGATLGDALKDLIIFMRESAEICIESPSEYNAEFLVLMLKVYLSSDKELISCLDMKPCLCYEGECE
ncbi:MAG: hypothetical protein IJQ58_12090 [Synergistaceae bacterium]|nr:hypothetical protein [Synergistaceae bacterium]